MPAVATKTRFVIMLTESRAAGLPLRAISRRAPGDGRASLGFATTYSMGHARLFPSRKAAKAFLAKLPKQRRWIFTVLPA